MKKKLTIIQVLPSLVSGGVEKGTLEVAKFLVEKGHKSIVISGGGRMVSQLVGEGSKHIQWSIGKKSLLTFMYVIRLIRLIQKTDIDIIHARSRLPAWIVFIALKLINKKRRPYFITTVHGFNSVSLYSAIMTKGDRVITVSKSVENFILKHYDVDKSKVFMNYRGVDAIDCNKKKLMSKVWLEAWRNEYPKIQNKIILSLPCRITRAKGHEDFLNLLHRLKKDTADIHGLIIGDEKTGNTGYIELLKKRIDDLNLKNDVTFTGYRKDVKNIIAISNIVYSLSIQPESFGRTIIESIKIKTPVLGYDHGGVGEQLRLIFPEGLVAYRNQEELYQKTKIIIKRRPLIKDTKLFDLKDMVSNTLYRHSFLGDRTKNLLELINYYGL